MIHGVSLTLMYTYFILLFLFEQIPVKAMELDLDQRCAQFINPADNDNEGRSNCIEAGLPPADVSPTTDLLSTIMLGYAGIGK